LYFQALLHRSDFFPGLGWLLTKNVWNEIKTNWPKASVRHLTKIKILFVFFYSFWDDWMRLPEQRHDRACIRPEISRTAISPEGKKGVSQ
jgi:alpha-1,3-mannosyl-glycoprotein beta-1,2-N-acetylglucosaminyltransferase